jgi:hypothetical protein
MSTSIHSTWQVARLDETLEAVVVAEFDEFELASMECEERNAALNAGVVDTQIVHVIIPPTGTFEIV